MITDVANRERAGEDRSARAAVGLQKGIWARVTGFISSVVGFIAGLAGVAIVAVSPKGQWSRVIVD